MKIQLRKLSEIRPYEQNPRRNDQAVDAVARSIGEFGFRQPIVTDADGVIIVGDTRFKAAHRLGLERVPVHVAEGLTPAQIRAYRVADNQTGAIAEWDDSLLALELGALQELDFDLDLLGFSESQLAEIFAPTLTDGLCDPDEVPAPPDEPTTRAGDLWILGNHRLLCGDSSKTADVDRLVDGAVVHLVNTDPPYNVGVEPRSNNAIAAGLSSFTQHGAAKNHSVDPTMTAASSNGHAQRGQSHHQGFDLARHPGKAKPTQKKLRAKDRPLANDFVSAQAFDELLQAWFGNLARVLLPGRSFFIWGGYANLGNYPPVLKQFDLYFSQAIVWDKQHPVLTRKDFMGAFELAFYGWKLGAAHQFFGPTNATDLWHVKKVNPQSMVHLTEKPVELAVRAMHYSSTVAENVLDLFGGSGSTLIAAEQTGRHAYLMELDPPYCDVIVERWQKFTGRQAKRQKAKQTAAPSRRTKERAK